MEQGDDQRPYDEGPSDDARYLVVVNDAEQYSIWPAGADLPPGWRPDGAAGDKDACLAHIDRVWTDLRPRSLREWMAVAG